MTSYSWEVPVSKPYSVGGLGIPGVSESPEPTPLSAEDIEKVRFYHVTEANGLRCNCGMFEPCHAKRLLASLDAARATVPAADEDRERLARIGTTLAHTAIRTRAGAMLAVVKDRHDSTCPRRITYDAPKGCTCGLYVIIEAIEREAGGSPSTGDAVSESPEPTPQSAASDGWHDPGDCAICDAAATLHAARAAVPAADEDRERLAALSDAATPGPWDTSDHREWLYNDKRQRFTVLPLYPGRTEEAHNADVDFIVAAVNYVRRVVRAGVSPSTGDARD